MKQFFTRSLGVLGLAAICGTAVQAQQTTRISMELLGTYHAGAFDEGAAEISAYDAGSKRLFVTNAETDAVDIVDLENPLDPQLISSIDIAMWGGGVNSVAVYDGLLAVAVENDNKQLPGAVAFFDTDGTFQNVIVAGALPDMVTFSPDGNYCVAANEGEPDDDYLIDPEGSVTIIDLSSGVMAASATQVSLTGFNGTTVDPSVRIFGPNATVAQDLEPEYVAIDPSSSTAYVACQENNALVIVDLATATATDLVGLGFKDHSLPGNELDASNEDGAINIQNWPVFGMYQPDAMVAYETGGNTYLVTANEGDARDYDGYSEEERVKDLVLDPTIFTDPTLQDDDQLGRLKTTTALADVNGLGEYQTIYCYGARSFSIWDEQGNLVFDSGAEFEEILEQEMPATFNSTNDDNDSFEDRSDDKGAEPEAVTVGEINGRQYAFVGLERMGGIMVYDITDPANSTFVEYFINRDFSVDADDPNAGDLGPEGLVFIPKESSPNKRNLLVASNEVSGTVSVYQINLDLTIDDEVELNKFELANTPVIGTYNNIEFREGGISGLHHIQGTTNEYYLITDRGPNAVADEHPMAGGDAVKLFPFPEYSPKIMKVTASGSSLSIDESFSLKRPDGSDASGIPLPADFGSTNEVAWSDEQATFVDPVIWGIDSEGIVEGRNGDDLWICDEYGSSVWQLNKTNGQVMARYTPFPSESEDIELPEAVGKRRPNRGFEGVAMTPNGKVYAILQSPVYNPDATASYDSRLHRLVEIDPETGNINTFVYEHDEPIGGIRNRDWKIGDLVAINNNEFLVLEHAEREGWNYKNVYKINISNATPLTTEDFGGQTLEQLIDADGAAAEGINVVEKTPMLDLLEAGWELEHDKPEGITILDNTTIAVINDNDYAIDSPDEDGVIVETSKTTKLYVYNLPNELALDFQAVPLSVEEEVASNNDLVVYPNPTDNGMVWFNQQVSGELVDLLGRPVMQFQQTQVLDVNAVPAGTYLIRTTENAPVKLMVR